MASVQYLFSLTNSLPDELRSTQGILTRVTKFRSICVTLIQKTWRKYFWRKWYLNVRNAVVTIQSYCRGWMVRKRRAQYLLQHQRDMYLLYLHKMATRIQAAWRGYLVRKYMKGRLPKDLLAYRKRIAEITEAMRAKMRAKFEENQNIYKQQSEDNYRKMVLYILFRCHHLLRTFHREGVFSLHKSNELSVIENLMKVVPIKDYMVELRKLYNEGFLRKSECVPYCFDHKNIRKFEDLLRLRDKSQDVRETIFNPSFFNENPFKLVGKICDKRYERELLSLEEFARPVLCALHNENDKNKNISEQDFLLGGKLEPDKTIPYYIDFWETNICSLHNPTEID